jgi:hypothetical protein
VLYVRAPGQVIGMDCVPDIPTGPGPMVMPPDDDMDAGPQDDDGGAAEPVLPFDAGMMGQAGANAQECPAGQHARELRGSVVHMVVQPAVLSEGRAGLVMPVPARPDVHSANGDLFIALGERLQPRIEEVEIQVEDASLGYQCRDPKWNNSGGGCGGDDDDDFSFQPSGDRDSGLYDPSTQNDPLQRVMLGDGEVSFATALSTRDYDVTVVSASTPAALGEWLDQNGYAHDEDDDEAFAAYVSEDAWFVALDLHPSGHRDLDPLVVSFPADTIPILHRLQYDPAGGELTTSVFVMADQRMDAADGSAETLYAAPAGFAGKLRGFGLDRGWITQLRLTRETSEQVPDSWYRAVPSVEMRPVLRRETRVRIPSSACPDTSSNDDGCGCRLAGRHDRLGGTFLPIGLALLWVGLRGRRRRTG